ncbi:hypothetical protein MVES1_003074 [Malassezia vespertilionis]|nr:uncharacterized protein MVES1_003074 [Malassezia vespertilionis]WFD07704.1 hypothetical protein MVES1_003074 [Malassezia vespertilionis]
MSLQTPPYTLNQDAGHVYVHIDCNADATTFGCFVEPFYLPLAFPLGVERMECTIALDVSGKEQTVHYDAQSRMLHVTLNKTEHVEFANLAALQPQLLSEQEMEHMEKESIEKDQAMQLTYSVGLLQTHSIPAAQAYEAAVASGRVPYIEVLRPGDIPSCKRTHIAEQHECEKWDEGMYLDATVDPDGLVAELIALPMHIPTLGTAPKRNSVPLCASRLALPMLLQVVFAYLYEMRIAAGDPSTESAWTICKLSRSLAAWTDPDPSMEQTFRAIFRRALTFPLYRTKALATKVCEDAVQLLSASPRERLLGMLTEINAIFALALDGAGSAEVMQTVLYVVWETWLAPLQQYIAFKADTPAFAIMRDAFTAMQSPTPAFLVAVGEPGGWDLTVLDAAAQEAQSEMEGQFV